MLLSFHNWRYWFLMTGIIFLIILILGNIRIIEYNTGLGHEFYSNKGITHDVVIKKMHSHNDYWRDRPLLDALSVGCISVESDVWYDNETDEIYVGHSVNALKKSRTLNSLYLDPIISILRGSNSAKIGKAYKHKAGVWFTEPNQTLFLFIDFKTDGHELYRKVYDKLNLLDNAGWLTYFDSHNDVIKWGAITIIGTGNIVLDDVLKASKRIIFYDGPVWDLQWDYDAKVSPVMSGSLRDGLSREVDINGVNNEEFEIVKKAVLHAHDKGSITRIWDTPGWPVKLRNSVWEGLIRNGVDLLNVDDLQDGSEF